MIEAKLKGDGIEDEDAPELDPSNVVDLMAALKKSLGSNPVKRRLKRAASRTVDRITPCRQSWRYQPPPMARMIFPLPPQLSQRLPSI
jgi:hypothetical protein